jgi:hypothetical protein
MISDSKLLLLVRVTEPRKQLLEGKQGALKVRNSITWLKLLTALVGKEAPSSFVG